MRPVILGATTFLAACTAAPDDQSDGTDTDPALTCEVITTDGSLASTKLDKLGSDGNRVWAVSFEGQVFRRNDALNFQLVGNVPEGLSVQDLLVQDDTAWLALSDGSVRTRDCQEWTTILPPATDTFAALGLGRAQGGVGIVARDASVACTPVPCVEPLAHRVRLPPDYDAMMGPAASYPLHTLSQDDQGAVVLAGGYQMFDGQGDLTDWTSLSVPLQGQGCFDGETHIVDCYVTSSAWSPGTGQQVYVYGRDGTGLYTLTQGEFKLVKDGVGRLAEFVPDGTSLIPLYFPYSSEDFPPVDAGTRVWDATTASAVDTVVTYEEPRKKFKIWNRTGSGVWEEAALVED